MAEALGRLASDLGDEVEVLIEVQDRSTAELGRGGDEQIRDRGSSVLSSSGEEVLRSEAERAE